MTLDEMIKQLDSYLYMDFRNHPDREDYRIDTIELVLKKLIDHIRRLENETQQ